MRIMYSQEMEIFYIDLEKGIQGTKVIYKHTHKHTEKLRRQMRHYPESPFLNRKTELSFMREACWAENTFTRAEQTYNRHQFHEL